MMVLHRMVMKVVGKLEFDAKSRGRSVQNHKLEFDAISQKRRKTQKKIIILYQWGYTGMKI